MYQNKLALITHCDINYLSRALSLIHSLREVGESAPIYVLCHDFLSLKALNQVKLERVYGITKATMFELFPELEAEEKKRSSIEFYYLFSPYLLKYLQQLNYEQLVYLDADLYFFGTLESSLRLVQNFDVGIVPHRFDAANTHLNIYGIYNVGLVFFKNNCLAMKTLDWWAKSCIQSTKLEVTKTSFGDQKYLDYFEQMDAKVCVFESHGDNAAPWNSSVAELTKANEIFIRGEKLCYFHFSGLQVYRKFVILGFARYKKKPNKIMKRMVYRKYINALIYWESVIGNPDRRSYRKIGLRKILDAIKYRDLLKL